MIGTIFRARHAFQRFNTLTAGMAVFIFFYLCAPQGVSAAPFGDKPYSADVVLKEVGRAPKVCGSVLVAHGKARLDVDLGKPGVFRAIFLPNEKALLVLSDTLKGYVTLPVTGEERDLRALVMQAARSVMPVGVSALDILETESENLGNKVWQGWTARVIRAQYEAHMMGAVNSIKLEIWENAALAPFPLRLINLNAGQGATSTQSGDTVELANINTRPAIPQDAFFVPESYTRYSSVLNLLLYSITGF